MTYTEDRSSTHPSLAGREGEMGALADVVRRLVELTVTCDMPADEADAIVRELSVAAERISQHVPDPFHARWASPSEPGPLNMQDALPYDPVIGRYNPLAPALRVEIAPPGAVGRGIFTKAYEGGPGWVHGAAIAAAFDLVLTAANLSDGGAGPTRQLSIRYRRPTRLNEECVFEGWVDSRTDKRVVSKGRLLQGDVVTVESEGEFAVMDPEHIGK